jgi:hypothetical protein
MVESGVRWRREQLPLPLGGPNSKQSKHLEVPVNAVQNVSPSFSSSIIATVMEPVRLTGEFLKERVRVSDSTGKSLVEREVHCDCSAQIVISRLRNMENVRIIHQGIILDQNIGTGPTIKTHDVWIEEV